MLDKQKIANSLRSNLDWFENSGVMDPVDGSWGVGERIVLTKGNQALEKIYQKFPAYIEFDDYSIIQHRRGDCNFQVALLYWLAADCLEDSRYLTVSRNILRYLFRRSGLNTPDPEIPPGVWIWATARSPQTHWFDDNAWNCVIPLLMADLSDDLEKEFGLRQAGLRTAEALEKLYVERMEVETREGKWGEGFTLAGRLFSPHWGWPVCMALSYAFSVTGDAKYHQAIEKGIRFMQKAEADFTNSEHAYIVLGASFAAAALGDDDVTGIARSSADLLISRMGPAGNLPSQWFETPAGQDLVDLVYTQNWAVLGFQALFALTQDPKYLLAYEKCMQLLINIQDKSAQKHLRGCWRGLFDLAGNSWGGGDCYEGGANSIYTGWTNAPIAISLALELMGGAFLPITSR